MLLRQVLFAVAVIGAHESVEGSRRAAIVFLTIDIVGTLTVLFVIVPGFVAIHPTIGAEALSVRDVGMSAGGFGIRGALVALQSIRWLLLVTICLAIFAKISI